MNEFKLNNETKEINYVCHMIDMNVCLNLRDWSNWAHTHWCNSR